MSDINQRMKDVVTIDRELVHRLSEHEILLSFVNDIDAYHFNDWWFQKGFDLYQEYVSSEEAFDYD